MVAVLAERLLVVALRVGNGRVRNACHLGDGNGEGLVLGPPGLFFLGSSFDLWDVEALGVAAVGGGVARPRFKKNNATSTTPAATSTKPARPKIKLLVLNLDRPPSKATSMLTITKVPASGTGNLVVFARSETGDTDRPGAVRIAC